MPGRAGPTAALARLRQRVGDAVVRRTRPTAEADLLLLLPRLPRSAAVLGPASGPSQGPSSGWTQGLARWEVRPVGVAAAELVVVPVGTRVPADLSAPTVLLLGRRRSRLLRRAGYRVRTYRLQRLPHGVVLLGAGTAGLALGRRSWGTGGAGRPGALLDLLLRPGPVTVASRTTVEPSALAASGLAGPDARSCLAVDERDVRRRAVLLLGGAGREGGAVVKVARSPGAEDRGGREQQVLSQLPGSGVVAPRPLGAGRTAALAWSAETALTGTPLPELLVSRPRDLPVVLARLAEALRALAVHTGRPEDWSARAAGPADAVVALRGPATRLRPLLGELDGVPAVLVHGDLESGANVLVGPGAQPRLLDWETARDPGLPLLDLLPLLCAWTGRAGPAEPLADRADRVLALATGRHPSSAWLLSTVRGYADSVALPAPALGRLGLLAWAHSASLRAVHDELVRAAGLPVTPWQSLAELVLARWEREVGLDWPALDDYPPG